MLELGDYWEVLMSDIPKRQSVLTSEQQRNVQALKNQEKALRALALVRAQAAARSQADSKK
jgi:hypothetical protein